jgi:glucose/arabinose dehydrogenase
VAVRWIAVVVADAGANALLRVAANGDISTLAVFPSRAQGRSTDAVPTAVAVGPDGAYYISELTGVPFVTGAANIYRVVPGQAPTVAWSGFTTVIDIAFGPDGSLYVLEHSTGPVFFALPGRLLRVAPNGTRTTVIDGLTRPGSVAVRPDGALYVSNRGTSIGTGEVLRIEP